MPGNPKIRPWEIAFSIAALALLTLLAMCSTRAFAADRCRNIAQDVRVQHEHYFGLGFPWHYGVGQLQQESNCRPDARAPDGGLGLAQFMPATAAALSRQLGVPLDPLVAGQATQMQAYFVWKLQRANPAPGQPLWVAYQAYNGGWDALRGEAARAGSWNRLGMRMACRRKKITLGRSLVDLCDVNYGYPQHIHQYGDAYRISPDSDGWKFW